MRVNPKHVFPSEERSCEIMFGQRMHEEKTFGLGFFF